MILAKALIADPKLLSHKDQCIKYISGPYGGYQQSYLIFYHNKNKILISSDRPVLYKLGQNYKKFAKSNIDYDIK